MISNQPNQKRLEEAARVRLVNLGCPKNEVDSEEMLGVLVRSGFQIDATSEDVDVVLVNSCGFIESAREESIDVILDALESKKSGKVRKVIVAGCMVQRYASELKRELPEVDVFLGAGRMSDIGIMVRNALSTDTTGIINVAKPRHRWLDAPVRVRTGCSWSAYLKISEGCDHKCTFCAIPSMRGEHVSKPLERVISEAEELAASGAKEINLIAQDSTQYGYDLYKRPMLPELLRCLAKIEEVQWLRLFYCYPSRVNDDIIEVISSTPKVCQYIDMPLQHADEEILKRMKRPGGAKSYLNLIERFRKASPDICFRTTFIVGFPGEQERHFRNLLEFVEEAKFDHVGVFEYSQEEGTPSSQMSERVPLRVRRQRKNDLLKVQREISLSINKSWVGREIEALVEEVGNNVAIGRSFRDAPEIDGKIIIRSANVQPGEMISVRIIEAKHYDLIAEPAFPREPKSNSEDPGLLASLA
jgi:ribosomal protein S12 methylthiotransferase